MKKFKIIIISTVVVFLLSSFSNLKFNNKDTYKVLIKTDLPSLSSLRMKYKIDEALIYNRSTMLFYNITNDKTNLILSVRAENPSAIQKIMESGITFTVSSVSNPKKISIMYPLLGIVNKTALLNDVQIKPKKSGQIDKSIDTLSIKINTFFKSNAKELKIAGLALKDTLDTKSTRDKLNYFRKFQLTGRYGQFISVKNSCNITVQAFFDLKHHYNYILSVPFKFLNLKGDEHLPIKCNLTVNGRVYDDVVSPGYSYRRHYSREGLFVSEKDQDLNHPTFFNVNYNLKN